MATLRDLRKTVRERLDDPRLAVVFFETEKSSVYHFANVLNLGIQGVLIESDKSFESSFKPKLMMKNPELNQWDTFFCRVAWAQISESEKQYKTGLEFLFPVDNGIEPETNMNGEITAQDIEFLLNTRLFNALPKDTLCSLLNCLSRKTLDQGALFFPEEGHLNSLYIIQKGICKIRIKDKNEFSYMIEQRSDGDIIGDMALLSTEPFIADAVSESEMVVWELPKAKLDKACTLQPVLIDFLTELLTNKFKNPLDSDIKCVGRHMITQQLGEGKTSIVFKGRHQLLNVPVAIKMIKHHRTMKKDDLSTLKKRINRISSLNHPNIVQIYDIKEQYRTLFIIMEYIEGDTLESFFEKQISLSFETVMIFLAQICSALAHAHDQKIFHKHLTPSNIFISNDLHVTMSDFEVPFPIPEEGFIEDRNVYYMAPEQIKGGKTDLRSNIYSLGILAYEMLTGQLPFSSENQRLENMNQISTDKVTHSPAKAPDLLDFLKNFIFKACSKSPDQRHGSVHEIIKELSNESKIFRNAMDLKKNMAQDVSALLISYTKTQRQDLFKLLDEFGQKALDHGIKVNITGKIQIH
ncbi:MAG: protein kinase [Desulfobacula sp.]